MQKSSSLVCGNGVKIDYTIKLSRSKYIYLRFKPDLSLEVSIPFPFANEAEKIILKKRSWILKKYRELTDRVKIFEEGKVLINGKYYVMMIIPSANGINNVNLQEDRLRVETNETNIISVVKSWMRARTEEYLSKNLPLCEKKVNLKTKRYHVKDISKWGYCSNQHELYFSLQLISLPERLREYVVIHELLHIIEFNHSKRFHMLINNVCPECKQIEKALHSLIPMRKENSIH